MMLGESPYAGERNGSWKGEQARYFAKHARVYRRRGPARDHQCVRCPAQAADWAQLHTETGDDPWADYVPMCHSCHMIYDGIGGFTPEARIKIADAHRGSTRSSETRARMSRAHTGVPLSADHRASLSRAQQARRQRERNERSS